MTRRYQDGGVASHTLPLQQRGAVPAQSVLGPTRAVVLRTYYPDTAGTKQGLGVECDVLTYGPTGKVLYRVPVKGGGGAYSLEFWTPSPTTKSLRTGRPVSWTSTTVNGEITKVDSAADLDGDHVLVEFLGGRSSDPLITAPLPHPRASRRPKGSNLTPIEAGQAHPATPDAPCRYVRHGGTVAMVDRRGSVVVDTTSAPETTGGDPAGGSEPAANVVVQLAGTARLEVRIGSAVLLVVENGQVKIGDSPTMHGVLFEALKTIWDAHTHPTGFGPSGPPTALPTSCKSPGVLLDAP